MKEPITRKQRLPSLLRWIVWVLVVQFILFNISAAIYAHRLTHLDKKPVVSSPPESGNIFSRTWKLFTGPRQARSPVFNRPFFKVESLELQTRKGISINAWYGEADSAARGTVIFFHGMTTNKTFLVDEAHECRSWGYNVLLVDFRGHGESGGNTSTIGFRETEEVKLAYDFIRQRGEGTIFLYGVSLGAVVVARAVSKYGLRPAGLVLDMPFASLQSYLKNKARALGFPGQPFAFLTTAWIGIERGFNGYRHQTTRYVKELTCPVLLQWGARDGFILRGETERIFAAIGSPRKKMAVYEQAGHESFLGRDPVKWRIEMEKFLGEAGNKPIAFLPGRKKPVL